MPWVKAHTEKSERKKNMAQRKGVKAKSRMEYMYEKNVRVKKK